jgi:hypothetical protein
MPFKIVEELKTHNPAIYLSSQEDAERVLILDNWTREETIDFLDKNGWPVWHNNRESLINSTDNVQLEWDQESQILRRTLIFESEELFDEFRNMCRNIFPSHPRELIVKEATDI